jgi:hypothetical protein
MSALRPMVADDAAGRGTGPGNDPQLFFWLRQLPTRLVAWRLNRGLYRRLRRRFIYRCR